MTTIRTFRTCADWMHGAAAAFGDPAHPICHLVFRWQLDVEAYLREAALDPEPELAVGLYEGQLALVLPYEAIPLPLQAGPPAIADAQILHYGAERIGPHVWCVSPSLNLPEVIHGFVTLYDVPDPPPWPAVAAAEEPLIKLVEG